MLETALLINHIYQQSLTFRPMQVLEPPPKVKKIPIHIRSRSLDPSRRIVVLGIRSKHTLVQVQNAWIHTNNVATWNVLSTDCYST